MAVVSPDPKVDTEAEEGEGSLRSSAVVQNPGKAQLTAICVGRAVVESISGGFLGSIFGYAKGLLKEHGLKGSFADAASNAKTFAVLSGVYTLAHCFLKSLRGKDDELNSGIAGCLTGLALSCPGTPQVMLQSCVTLGGFSWIMDKYGKQRVALALPLSTRSVTLSSSAGVLPPFTLALPQHTVEGFSLFCRSLKKPKRVPRRQA